MTQKYHITENDRVTLFQRALRLKRYDEVGYVFGELDKPHLTHRIGFQEFVNLLAGPDMVLQRDFFSSGSRLREIKHGDAGALTRAQDDEQMTALWRKACVDAFYTLYLQAKVKRKDVWITPVETELRLLAENNFGRHYQEAKSRAGQRIEIPKFPKPRALLTWVRNYEKAGYHIDGLVSRYYACGNRHRRFNAEELALISRVVDLYASTQKPNKAKAVRRTIDLFHDENASRKAEGHPELLVPSQRTVRRFLDRVSPYYLDVKRLGIDAANRKHIFRTSGLDVQMPLERVEVDENKLDVISLFVTTGLLDVLPADRLESLEKGRRYLYLFKDCATKCVLSLRLAAAQNAEDAIRGLKDVLRDKTAVARAFGCTTPWHMRGRPFQIVTDHGVAFTSAKFKLACERIGVGLEHPPVGQPALRGNVESIFLTLGHELMPHLIGRTFSNTKERGDYPAEYLASLTDDELIMTIVSYIVDIYHRSPHSGLGGETPLDAWERHNQANNIPTPPDGHELRAAFGRPFERTLNKSGITLFGIDYSCDELRDAYLHSPTRKVTVRADLDDLGWVSISVGGQTVPARANKQIFSGMNYVEWQEIRRNIRQTHRANAEVHIEQIRRAYDRIDGEVRKAMLRNECTPFYIKDEDVLRNERSMRLTIRKDEVDPDAPLENLISPPELSTNPLARGKRISPQPYVSHDLSKAPGSSSLKKRWEFKDD